MEDCCCICQENLSAHESTTLHCGHVFHAKCLCNHFYINDNRCPLCRHGPRQSLEQVEEDEDDGLAFITSRFLSWPSAYKKVRQACRKKKQSKEAKVLRQMCDTYKKWEAERKKQRKASKAMYKEWNAIQKKARDDTKKKHADFLENMRQTKKRFATAKSQWRASRLRILRKAREEGGEFGSQTGRLRPSARPPPRSHLAAQSAP